MDGYEPLEAMNGHPLRVERCRRNLTQVELADAIQVGVTTIWRAEKDYPISAASRQRICTYFGLTSQELGLTGKEKMKPVATLSNIISTQSNNQHTDIGLNFSNTVIDLKEQGVNPNDFVSLSALVNPTVVHPLNIDLFQQVASLLNTPPTTLQSIDEHVIMLWNYRSKGVDCCGTGRNPRTSRSARGMFICATTGRSKLRKYNRRDTLPFRF